MILVSKERNVIVNFDNVDAIGFKSNEVENKTIVAHLVGGNSVELATYETEEQANTVFGYLMETLEDECYDCFNF